MKKINRNMFVENPNVEAFVIFHGTFKPFYLAINKGAPIEKRIKSIFKPDGYAWAEDVAYDCSILVVPQSKKAYDAFVAYFISSLVWTKKLCDFHVQVLPYERNSFQKMKGGMYFRPNKDIGIGWTHSFATFSLGMYYDDSYVFLPFFDEEIPRDVRLLMKRIEEACSHLREDQEEKVRELYETLWNIYGEGYGKDIPRILE